MDIIFKYCGKLKEYTPKKRKMLNIIDSFEKLKENKFPIANHHIIKSEADLKKLQFPCWLKVNIEGHKTEEKAVIKANNLKEAEKTLKDLRKRFPENSIIAQEQVDGIEMIIGIKEDKVFGKLLMIGFGGTLTEIIKDISFRALPIDKKEIEKMISELKLSKILNSGKKFAIDELISLAEKLSKLDVKEADFNPVIVNEKEAVIVDARLEI